ncbi:MAG TPA: hypothetical protein VFY93_14675 [Planctomycetota bacterium]|nr:hypothetical protein [Planctomycetota bacterium]
MKALALCIVLVAATLWAASSLLWSSGSHHALSPARAVGVRDEPCPDLPDAWSVGWAHSYFGTLDGVVRIGLTVRRGDAGIEGLYFEVPELVDHRVEVRLGKGRAVGFLVRDSDGRVAAAFRGEFTRTDPLGRYGGGELQREVIVGVLRRRDRPASHRVYLSEDHSGPKTLENMYANAYVVEARSIDERAVALQRAVADHDRATVAGMVRFPIWARTGGAPVRLASEKRFLKVYDRVFTPSFGDRIAEAIPHHMFSKYSGVMLGNGQIWFDKEGRIVAINN